MTKLIEVTCEGEHDERPAEALSNIKPGHLLQPLPTGEVRKHSVTPFQHFGKVALENVSTGGGIDTVYDDGELVRYSNVKTGQKMHLRVAAGTAAITLDTILEASDDGTVIPNQATTFPVAYPEEAVDNSAGTEEVLILVRIA